MNGLKKIRKSLDLSVKEVSSILGCTNVSVYNYERDHLTIPISKARKIIEIAGDKGHSITLDDIYADLD